ncbi:MAG: hypothetical protein KC910_08355 [Candidatus Eremiobacteraeota bacterium]|nr:hypothetical protein [Candidatus Eremiobacteraeota bacterium]
MTSQENQNNESKDSTWTYVTLGIGAGLILTLAAGMAYRYWSQQHQDRDPRAEKVQELILEAERLLAQGRRARSSS